MALRGDDGGAGALLGDRVAGWLDPMVAMAMSVWLIWAWGGQCYTNVMNLVGTPLHSCLSKCTHPEAPGGAAPCQWATLPEERCGSEDMAGLASVDAGEQQHVGCIILARLHRWC